MEQRQQLPGDSRREGRGRCWISAERSPCPHELTQSVPRTALDWLLLKIKGGVVGLDLGLMKPLGSPERLASSTGRGYGALSRCPEL